MSHDSALRCPRRSFRVTVAYLLLFFLTNCRRETAQPGAAERTGAENPGALLRCPGFPRHP